MKKKVKIVIVPTDKATGLFKRTMDVSGNPLFKQPLEFTTNETLIRNNHLISNRKAATNAQNRFIFYNLHIVSNDTIKEGDCVTDGTLMQLVGRVEESLIKQEDGIWKIIASTDSSLKLFTIKEEDINWFLLLFNTNGKFPEIAVEEYMETTHKGGIDSSMDILKANPDGSIEIAPAEERLYSREEMENKIIDAVAETLDWSRENHNINSIGLLQDRFLNKWIKENLK